MKNKRKILILGKEEQPWLEGKSYFQDDYDLIFSGFDKDNIVLMMKAYDIALIIIGDDLEVWDPLEILLFLKAHYNLPVMMILSNSKQSIDKVVGLEMGADDLISRPFEWRELVARIRANLRLIDATRSYIRERNARKLAYFAGWIMHPDKTILYSEIYENQILTAGEFRLLKAFLSMPGCVISREELLEISHKSNMAAHGRSVDVLIARLRKKLKDNANPPVLLKTIRGIGYVLDVNVEYYEHSPEDATQKQLKFYF